MTDHVYIIGAGRSGTTLLSALLAANPGVQLTGELLQFPSFWQRNHFCSCGKRVRDCEHWPAAGHALDEWRAAHPDIDLEAISDAEGHRRFMTYLLRPTAVPAWYLELHDRLVAELSASKVVVDASKYPARAIAFSRLVRHRFRYVYIVRDCRGVFHSFGKSDVQERRGTLSTLIYYWAVNLAAEIARTTRLRGSSLKIRYEDLVNDPRAVIERVGRFLDLDVSKVVQQLAADEPIPIAHMVSGNRFTTRGTSVKVNKNEEWRAQFGPWRRLGLHLLCLPFQLLNRYRL